MISLEKFGYFLPQGYLFKDVNLQVKIGDKIGLVGKNGAGKSTLLKLISGRIKPTEGNLNRSNALTIGMLSQDIIVDSEEPVLTYLMDSNEQITKLTNELEYINEQLVTRQDYESEAYLSLLDRLNEANHLFSILDGYTWEEKVVQTLKGLGFNDDDLTRPLNSFSGGWKMRAELAKILVNNPDVLLLDEPTNHLDIVSISWLENYLESFPGAIILISHDRYFLDKVTKRTWDISLSKISDYPFAFSKYKEIRAEEKERTEGAKKQQDKDIKQTKELIDKFRAKKNKAAFAQSLIKKLEKTEIIQVEEDEIARIKLRFPLSVEPGKVVLDLEGVGKSFGEKTILKHISITVGRGEKIALLGPNGVGKSTLLKRIMNVLEGEGSVSYGHNVNLTYFAQDQADKLDPTKSIYETVDLVAKGEIRKELRSILGAFLFKGEDVDKKVGVLSGGERTRLALCCLLLSPSNVLILDEPTNHLDIQSKQVLKEALVHYQGTFIVVSHDREFLDDLTNRIWDIEDKTLKIHHFGVSEYLKRKLELVPLQQKEKTVIETNQVKISKEIENKNVGKNKSQLENKLKKVEQEITNLELAMEKSKLQMEQLDYSNTEETTKVLADFNTKKEKMDTLLQEWESLSEELLHLNS